MNTDSGFLQATFLLLGFSLSLTYAMDKEEFHKLFHRMDISQELIEKMHYDISPEFAETMRLLVRLDRHTLKTILENEAALFENILVSTIFEYYNVNKNAGYCATQKERAHRKTIQARKTEIESVIDKALDTMYKKWGELRTQDDLEAYFTKYWGDRNALYNYVSHRNSERNCSEVTNQQCTAVESLEASFSRAMAAMGQCD